MLSSINFKTVIISVATFLATLFVMAAIVFVAFQFIRINHLETQKQGLVQELQALEQDRQGYEEEEEFIESNYIEYLEDYIRRVLGWSKDGEMRFVIQ